MKHDPSEKIPVSVSNDAGRYNLRILKKEDRNRLLLVPKDQAAYFITNYRWHPMDYGADYGSEYHSIRVGHNTINTIFKLRQQAR